MIDIPRVSYARRCVDASRVVAKREKWRPHWSDNSDRAIHWRNLLCQKLRGETSTRLIRVDLEGGGFLDVELSYATGKEVPKGFLCSCTECEGNRDLSHTKQEE